MFKSNKNADSDTAAPHELKPIEWFRQATPYINAHRNKTFVIMLSGDAVADHHIHNLIHDIVLLNSLGIKIVIVHGVRAQLDQKLLEENITSQFIHGLRVSTQAVLEVAIQTCGLIRSRLETKLSMGLPNSPMHGARVRVASANVITAKPAGIIDGIDLQHTGLVRKVDANTINSLLDIGNVVLLSPIGHSPTGEVFNLGFQHVASEIAIALNADKLIAFTDKEGLYTTDGALLQELNPHQATVTLQGLDESGEVYRCADAAIKAVQQGVPRAHIMSYACDGALLQELFSVDGAGTLIQKDHFEEIRQAKSSDIPAIIDIIRPLEQQDILVKRDRDKLEKEIDRFMVIEREGLLIALAALYPFNEIAMGEIACITTHPDYQNASRGATLLAAIEKKAREEKLMSVFVLTTHTDHWFVEQGFQLSSIDSLPPNKQNLYNFQRNSKVLIKKL